MKEHNNQWNEIEELLKNRLQDIKDEEIVSSLKKWTKDWSLEQKSEIGSWLIQQATTLSPSLSCLKLFMNSENKWTYYYFHYDESEESLCYLNDLLKQCDCCQNECKVEIDFQRVPLFQLELILRIHNFFKTKCHIHSPNNQLLARKEYIESLLLKCECVHQLFTDDDLMFEVINNAVTEEIVGTFSPRPELETNYCQDWKRYYWPKIMIESPDSFYHMIGQWFRYLESGRPEEAEKVCENLHSVVKFLGCKDRVAHLTIVDEKNDEITIFVPFRENYSTLYHLRKRLNKKFGDTDDWFFSTTLPCPCGRSIWNGENRHEGYMDMSYSLIPIDSISFHHFGIKRNTIVIKNLVDVDKFEQISSDVKCPYTLLEFPLYNKLFVD